LVTGEIMTVNWDESDIAREDNGFDARYKGVYFDEEYANGKLSSLHGMQIEYMSLDTESDSDSDIVITDMTFEDEGERYTRSIFFLSLICCRAELTDLSSGHKMPRICH